MAITTYRQTAAPGWATTSVIYQLEAAFTQLGWHGGTVSGIVTGLASYSGQTQVGTSNTTIHDARPKSGGTSIGVGDTCSFSVLRSGGNVYAVYPNRGGHGYADGDNLVIDGDAIGGGNDMTVVVQADETSYGSASTFYDKDVTVGSSYPWGVLRIENDNNKVYGDSYFGFQSDGTKLYFSSGTSFYPYNNGAYLNKQGRYANSFRGQYYQDVLHDPTGQTNQLVTTSVNTNIDIAQFEYASSNAFTSELNVFRSGIDNNFAVFSFKHPDKSSSSIDDNTYGTFFLHKFTHSLLNFDELSLGTMSYFDPVYRDMSNAHHEMHTSLGNSVSQDDWLGRQFMMGWNTGQYYYIMNTFLRDYIHATTYPTQRGNTERRHYYRNNDNSEHNNFRGDLGLTDYTNKSPDVLNHNAVIKGIPLSSHMVPCPFYLPDDFVLIQFDHASPGQNIQQYDTVTISGSEVYTVIDGAYNQTNRTRGILFCARTVG